MRSRHGDNRTARAAVLLALALTVGGCIVQGDKCSPNQVAYAGQVELCLCAPDYVTDSDGTGCVACGENQTASFNKCVCKPGYGRKTEADACTPVESKSSCASDADCSAASPHCAQPAAGSGYCTTTGCNANADCLTDWSCETAATVRYCARPPTGLGSSCQSNADCASQDARYCDTRLSHTCLLAACATGGVTCPNEWLCCDYSSLLGSALSICISPSVQGQAQGTCPQGGTKVGP